MNYVKAVMHKKTMTLLTHEMPSQELERHHAVVGHVEEMHCVNQLSHGHRHVDHPAERTQNSTNLFLSIILLSGSSLEHLISISW